jgi:hypothetical protein
MKNENIEASFMTHTTRFSMAVGAETEVEVEVRLMS